MSFSALHGINSIFTIKYLWQTAIFLVVPLKTDLMLHCIKSGVINTALRLIYNKIGLIILRRTLIIEVIKLTDDFMKRLIYIGVLNMKKQLYRQRDCLRLV